MDFAHILATMNAHDCQYLLIGGYNFSLRHHPYTTLDIDLWIQDSLDNRRRCEAALITLNAEWGENDANWRPVKQLPADWLDKQHVFSLLCPHGLVDIFRSVKGLDSWEECYRRSFEGQLKDGTRYRGLSDSDMLLCQLALEEHERKLDRIRALQNALKKE
jgi:hypothetical protein